MLTLLFLAACFLAYSNGANDNFKGVASLYGSKTTDYRTAICWATATTFAGSVASIFLAATLLKKFSGNGLVPAGLAGSEYFVLAVAVGAGLTVILAARNGFPVSTTHALTGAMVGSGWMAVGSQVNLIRQKISFPASLVMCCLACTSLSAVAGPPFLTDDPEPVDHRHSEFYIASQQVKTTDGRSGTLPHIEYNYGVAPDTHLHIIVPYAFSNPTAGTTEKGLGDTELGIKYRFVQETEHSPMVGIFPIYLTHTGDHNKGLGAGGSQLFLPLWVQKKWGEWQSYGGGGYWISHAPDIKSHWFVGWQVQKEISERITLGGEIFHSTEQAAGQGSSTGFNIGGSYNFDEHNHLLFSAGKGLQNIDQTNQLSTYLAYQWAW